MNNACRNKEEDKIEDIGAFSMALYWSTSKAERSRPEDSESLPKYIRVNNDYWSGDWLTIYRGLKLKISEIDSYRRYKGKNINLCGF